MIDWRKSVALRIAAEILNKGGVIAYPTEGVWGLGCDPFNADATWDILALKQRPESKGLILVAASIEQVSFLLDDLDSKRKAQLLKTWPGPNTWIIPHRDRVPSWIHGKHEGVAVRVSSHPVVAALCYLFGGPIVSTSANPQGLFAAQTALKVRTYFACNPRLNFITPGVVGQRGKASTIRDLRSLELIRA